MNNTTTNKAFLQYVANDIPITGINENQTNKENTYNSPLMALKDHCYVFPTRRAGIYFRQHLAERFEGEYFWAPHVFSIVEFTEYLTNNVVLDTVTLVFELYRVYKKYEPETKFDQFYNWGQLLIKDFDELDKYLVDAEQLFVNLKDIRNIEEFFELPEENLQFLQQFWNIFTGPKVQTEPESEEAKDNTELQKEFIRIWEVLAQVYTEFKQRLSDNNAAYDGMAQRSVLERLENGTLTLPFSRIVFAGFNALSTTEKRIIEHITQHYNASIYWDTDQHYMNDPKQEAGKFVRQYYQEWQQNEKHNWYSQTNFVQHQKSLNIIGAPLKVGQAKYMGQLLQTLIAEKSIKAQDSAIVLGNEGMLFPVLYSLPESIDAINISMGYPLKDTPLYQLLETIIQLQKTRQDVTPKTNNKQNDNNTEQAIETKTAFYSKFILQILNNPFIIDLERSNIDKYQQYITRNNLLYIYDTSIKARLQHPLLHTVFSKHDNFLQIIKCYNDVLVQLFSLTKQKTKQASTDLNAKTLEVINSEDANNAELTGKYAMEMEFIYHLLKNLKKLEETLHKYRQIITIDTFWKLFREVIQSVKLPFTGEPLRGIQIMGFLETRTLDFDNLFVLGINEGVIPATKPHQTFIPFNLRRAFGMPTFLDQDAIYAYHFYHLLQRATNIYLFYDTEVSSTNSNEKSRFLLQLQEEIKNITNTQVNVISSTVNTPIHLSGTQEKQLTVEKNKAILDKLNRYLVDKQAEETDKARYSFSPTALNTYINCPVQFYFKYIAELKELDELNEEINDMIFGNVLHKTIELLYQPFLEQQQVITAKEIGKLLQNKKKIDRLLRRAFELENFNHYKEGKNLLLRKVIFRLVEKILENDQQDAPFTLIGLEATEYRAHLDIGNGRQVAISGSIDRIDEILSPTNEKIIRVLDYKTGNVKIASDRCMKKGLDVYFDTYFTKPDQKAGFQAYLYSYLYWVQQQRNVSIKAGIYELKKINSGIKYLRKGEILSNRHFTVFEEKLRQLLQTIYDAEKPFIQTPKENHYTYSPFKGLVGLD